MPDKNRAHSQVHRFTGSQVGFSSNMPKSIQNKDTTHMTQQTQHPQDMPGLNTLSIEVHTWQSWQSWQSWHQMASVFWDGQISQISQSYSSKLREQQTQEKTKHDPPHVEVHVVVRKEHQEFLASCRDPQGLFRSRTLHDSGRE